MKQIIKLLTSKSIILGLLLLAQLVFLLLVVNSLVKNSIIGVYVEIFFRIFSFLIVIHIIASNDNPTYKMAWLIPVLGLPVFGTFFYLFYHISNVSPRSRNKYKRIIQNRFDHLGEHPKYIDKKEINYFNNMGWRDYKYTTSKFFFNANDKLESLLIDLEKAENFIFLEYFIFAKGEMFDEILKVLIKKASEGVEIKIIYDDFGSAGRIPFNFINKMKKYNIKVINFNRMQLHINFAMNYRDHRKIVVIDNKVAYTGGVNIGDEYINKVERYGYWSDTAIRLEGEAVWSMTLIFMENWNFSSKTKLQFKNYYSSYKVEGKGYYVPFGDNPLENEQVARNLYLYLIAQAKEEILITTPYLILDNEIMTSLKLANQSGVKIKIIIPAIPDKKLVYLITQSYAHELHQMGVEIYKYTPGFIHSKLLVVDSKVGLVGTTNLDFRSLYLHFENNVYMYDTNSIKDVEKYINETINDSALCSNHDLFKKGIIRNIFITILKGFGSIL